MSRIFASFGCWFCWQHHWQLGLFHGWAHGYWIQWFCFKPWRICGIFSCGLEDCHWFQCLFTRLWWCHRCFFCAVAFRSKSHFPVYMYRLLHFWSYLLAFILKLGINLPVRVGLGRRQNKWLQITNTNAGTLLGRSFGLQIQVLEWLVGVIFENHLDCAFDVVHIAKPEPAFFFASQQHFSSLVTWYSDHSPVPSDWHESAF